MFLEKCRFSPCLIGEELTADYTDGTDKKCEALWIYS